MLLLLLLQFVHVSTIIPTLSAFHTKETVHSFKENKGNEWQHQQTLHESEIKAKKGSSSTYMLYVCITNGNFISDFTFTVHFLWISIFMFAMNEVTA